jgi:glutathione S-transferase
VAVKLYALAFSHPSNAAAKMLEIKGIDYRRVDFMPGLHPLGLRLAGFRGGTVPALRIDGRRIQGSLPISRALEEMRPQPPLFPDDPEMRRRVEDAERWGDAELQHTPRRLLRWGLAHNRELRTWFASLTVPAAVARPAGELGRGSAVQFARKSHAIEDQVRLTIERLPGRVDHVDELIAAGVLGGREPNAADLQIASTLRVLLGFADTRAALEGRPAGELALRLFPRFPDVPPFLPADWLSPLQR